MNRLVEKVLQLLNFAGFVGTWLIFASLDLFNGLLLFGVTSRGFALADSLRALLIDILFALPALFLSRHTYKRYTLPVFFFLALVNMLNVFHILTYQSAISTYAIFAMLETTGPESLEFLTDQFSMLKVLVVFSSLLIPCLLYSKVFKRNILFGKKIVAVIGMVLFVISLFVLKTAVAQGYRFLGSDPAYLTAWSLNRYYEEAHKATQEKALPPNIFGHLESDDGPQTYVIIVGESANRNHMGIYGYTRNNTPYAEKDGWITFNNVTSPAAHTIPSLKQVLRFSGFEQDGMQPSIIDLFNDAGFKTFWLSNQTAPKGSGNILEAMTARTDTRCYINLSRKEGKSVTFDGELLPYLEKALADPAGKKAIFLHLLGSHLTYALRYPRERGMFHKDSVDGLTLKEWYDDNAVEHVNHYDNSIAYTDSVLHGVLEKIKKITEPSFVLYFSDHGQDVYDTRYMRGCSEKSPTKDMLEVPMFLWLSPAYRQLHPARVQFLEGGVNRAYSTRTLSGTIARLADIKSDKLASLHTLFSKDEDTNRIILGKVYRDMPR